MSRVETLICRSKAEYDAIMAGEAEPQGVTWLPATIPKALPAGEKPRLPVPRSPAPYPPDNTTDLSAIPGPWTRTLPGLPILMDFMECTRVARCGKRSRSGRAAVGS